MSLATPAQINALRIAAGQHGRSVDALVHDYFGASQSLSTIPAHLVADMIARAGETVEDAPMPDVAAIMAEVAAAKAKDAADRDARFVSSEDFQAAQDAKAAADARIDAILNDRGQGDLTGKDRREARRLIRRELEA